MNNVSFDEINALIEKYRDRCLWFLAPRYIPTIPDEAMRTLNLIERYSARAAYLRADPLPCLCHATLSAVVAGCTSGRCWLSSVIMILPSPICCNTAFSVAMPLGSGPRMGRRGRPTGKPRRRRPALARATGLIEVNL